MIVNQQALLELAPIKNMLPTKERLHGVSHGLSEAGYDIRLKQHLFFIPDYQNRGIPVVQVLDPETKYVMSITEGRFTIASAIEEFQMPDCLVGVVHDKSTWARQSLSVFNTVIEPSWKGFLTLELVYHGHTPLEIPAGAGIAQVLFHRIETPASYEGKYNGQPDRPVSAIMEASNGTA